MSGFFEEVQRRSPSLPGYRRHSAAPGQVGVFFGVDIEALTAGLQKLSAQIEASRCGYPLASGMTRLNLRNILFMLRKAVPASGN